jgi:hypothetical protein
LFLVEQLAGLIEPNMEWGKQSGFHNPLYIMLSPTREVFDARIFNHMSQGASENGPRADKAFQLMFKSVVLLGTFIICAKGLNIAKNLQKSSNKIRIPVFWGAATLGPVFTLYMLGKYVLCHCPLPGNAHSIVDCLGAVLAIMLIISVCGMAATVHSKHLNLPHPKICEILRCCCRKQPKVLTTLPLWGIYCSILCLLYSAPHQVLMVCANPHMYGLAIITAWCAMIGLIMMTAIPFTIDQIFLADKDFRITPK